MRTNHGAGESGNSHIIDEKSFQDKVLSCLAIMVLVGLVMLGCYWQSLPLPAVQAEEESQEK